MDIFSARLKWVRENKGVSQKEVADQIGMSPQGYGKIENGQREPNLESLGKIALIFGVSTDFLIGVTDLDTTAFEMLETASSILGMVKRQHEAIVGRRYQETDNEKFVRLLKVTEIMERDYETVKKKLNMYVSDIPFFSFNGITDEYVELFHEKNTGRIRERFLMNDKEKDT